MNRWLVIVVFILLSTAFVGQAIGDGGGFYIEAKIGASQQKVKRDVAVNEPLLDPGTNLQINTGAIPVGSLSHSSLVGGVAFGYNFAPRFNLPIRFELEFLARGYRNVNQAINVQVNVTDNNNNQLISENVTVMENSKIGVHTIMGNIYYDFLTSTSFTPFVGVGAGLSILHLKINSLGIEDYYEEETNFHAGDVQFAWGFTGGVSYALNEDWSLSLAYKYTDAGSKSLTADRFFVGLDSDVKIHDGLLGLRYSF